MGAKALIRASMEGIDFQDGQLHTRLTEEIGKIRSQKGLAKALKDSLIPEIIKKHTNCRVEIILEEGMPNAAVCPPFTDVNHPFQNSEWTEFLSNMSLRSLNAAQVSPKAGFDITTGKVYGFYANYLVSVYLTTGLLQNSLFTDAEVSGILLHELGHLFSYYEYMGYTYTSNLIMAGTAKEFFNTKDIAEREVILKVFEDLSGAKLEGKAELAKTNSEDVLVPIILKSYQDVQRTATNTRVYDQRSFEQMADNFAARQGASRDLATGLMKLYRFCGDRSVTPWIVHCLSLVAEVATLLVFLAIPFAWVLVFIPFVVTDPNGKIYDDPKERLENIRRQMVELLKDPTTPEYTRKQTLKDIALTDNLLKDVTEQKSLYETLWLMFSSTRAQAYDSVKFQKRLEELAANRLFVSANKLIYGTVDHE